MSTIYFAKMNINEQIYDIYNDPKLLPELLTKIYAQLSTKASIYDQFGGRIKLFDLDKNEDNTTIIGNMGYIKEGEHSSYDPDNDTAVDIEDPNKMEYIIFYFDVHKEMLAFTTSPKMRQKAVLANMTSLIKKTTNIGVEFMLEPNVEELDNRIREFSILKKLKVKLVPPNGDKKEFADIYSLNAEKVQNSRATKIEMNYSTQQRAGLDRGSELVQDNIDGVKMGYSEATFQGKDMHGEDLILETSSDTPYKKHVRASDNKNRAVIVEKSRAGIFNIAEYRTKLRLRAKNNDGENTTHK
ncbi:hypothetical protein [Lactiplantibacillus plantarum]|uniref:hypothetical protein n=1 Tax=Lactiplantibacillus plantarum TaxID=1590 RepID=UPI000A20610C|nr:hypothetical protein [Lactiplantibacillus plantarum]ARO01169.1 hypothetical protein BIZ31_10040 [Lactiplantibacillus plantarum]ARO04075.1 hypothetical protein BIZ32_09850 [Lactiplantibacillus plantarum]